MSDVICFGELPVDFLPTVTGHGAIPTQPDARQIQDFLDASS